MTAVKIVMARALYVLVPFSVLFIKYYPDLGRHYSIWTWTYYYTGVSVSKNSLGMLCFVFGLFCFWSLLLTLRTDREKKKLFIFGFLFVMVAWLLSKADSATSLGCVTFGIVIMLSLVIPFIRNNLAQIGLYVVSFGVLFVVLELSFGIIEKTILSLGRDMTLTGRTELWAELIAFDINPLFGTGYEGFWLGGRVDELWSRHWWKPTQAHNGYLELYLNLGLVGLVVLFGLLVSTYNNVRRELLVDFDYGRFRFAFLVLVIVYNVTEATFKSVDLVWFVFLLIACEPRPLKALIACEPRPLKARRRAARSLSLIHI